MNRNVTIAMMTVMMLAMAGPALAQSAAPAPGASAPAPAAGGTMPMAMCQEMMRGMMAGGPGNPLGARALYLGNTLYRIHGTNQPSTIGQTVSSGCIRLTNDDVADLYGRVTV